MSIVFSPAFLRFRATLFPDGTFARDPSDVAGLRFAMAIAPFVSGPDVTGPSRLPRTTTGRHSSSTPGPDPCNAATSVPGLPPIRVIVLKTLRDVEEAHEYSDDEQSIYGQEQIARHLIASRC
jgi:hypothetical protein